MIKELTWLFFDMGGLTATPSTLQFFFRCRSDNDFASQNQKNR